ncbi:hypothetical protein GCM10022402_46780 [Salinactinospora qingdaonensis]|uniref:Uncharacterized protein n=1 Tax=Salinactinospora qingdaonensis TaxID=702744 RepID=A0ABP7GII7_9ACTN
MWSVNTLPNPGFSSNSALSCGVLRLVEGWMSNVNPLVVVLLFMGEVLSGTWVGDTLPSQNPV